MGMLIIRGPFEQVASVRDMGQKKGAPFFYAAFEDGFGNNNATLHLEQRARPKNVAPEEHNASIVDFIKEAKAKGPDLKFIPA